MTQVTFSLEAYSKIVLHAAKYPHCAVNGLLLTEEDSSDSGEVNRSPEDIKITDVVPLFHLCLNVTPMSEIALMQVNQWADSVGLEIAGYYVANESFNDLNVDKPANKIADKIAESNNLSCLVVVDNKLMTLKQEVSALKVMVKKDKWEHLDNSRVLVRKSILEKTSLLLEKETYRKLVDFDNHLDNLVLDWRNTKLNDIIHTPNEYLE